MKDRIYQGLPAKNMKIFAKRITKPNFSLFLGGSMLYCSFYCFSSTITSKRWTRGKILIFYEAKIYISEFSIKQFQLLLRVMETSITVLCVTLDQMYFLIFYEAKCISAPSKMDCFGNKIVMGNPKLETSWFMERERERERDMFAKMWVSQSSK